MTSRLAEDHQRAKKLAEGLKKIPGIVLNNDIPATNMVFLSLAEDVKGDAAEIAGRLQNKGVLVDQTGKRSFRLVSHFGIDDTGVENAVSAFRAALM
jgi:threonine aldolase